MWKDAAPSSCDVVGCEASATGSYLAARDAQMLEFAVCPDHFSRLRRGERAVIAQERFGRHVLVLG